MDLFELFKALDITEDPPARSAPYQGITFGKSLQPPRLGKSGFRMKGLSASQWKEAYNLPADGQVREITGGRAVHYAATRMQVESVIAEVSGQFFRRRNIRGYWNASEPVDGLSRNIPLYESDPFADKALITYRVKERGQPCKQGEAAARTGCIPAQQGQGQPRQAQAPAQQQRPQPQEQEEQATAEQAQGQSPEPPQTEGDRASNRKFAPPPQGEELQDAPCCLYDPDPSADEDGDGVADASRIGVPARSVPPPPKEIPRLPNLTGREREVEARFADAYLEHADEMVDEYLEKLRSKEIGDAPNIFSTDDAKLLSPDYNPQGEGVTEDDQKNAKGELNVVVHQTANALAKKAFLKYLDDTVANLPEEKRTVLVTSGGVASGKTFALVNIDHTKDLMNQVGAVWDAAGEQNATENPWVLEECAKRGIKPIFVFVHADPKQRWDNPKSGVVERANNKGRMVNELSFAESYPYGAKNFAAFHEKHKDRPDVSFVIVDNSQGSTPQLVESVPPAALKLNPEEIYQDASKVLDERADRLRPAVVTGGAINRRIWGTPRGRENA